MTRKEILRISKQYADLKYKKEYSTILAQQHNILKDKKIADGCNRRLVSTF